MKQAPVVPSIAVLVVLAGCLSGQRSSTPDGLDSSGSESVVFGGLEGFVTDDEIRPLAKANVSLLDVNLHTVTEPLGYFKFPKVPAGDWVVRVQHERHEPRDVAVTVAPDSTQRIEVALVLLPSFVPYNKTFPFEGGFDCGHEIPIWTGDCMLLYKAITNQSDPYTHENFVFQFPIEARWDSVVMELKWQAGANNQLDGMRFYLERTTQKETDHSVKVGRADGNYNPLRFVVHRGVNHPRADVDPATGKPATFPANGSMAQIRAFPHGKFYNELCQVGNATLGECLLGVGVGVDIKFTIYATVFYNGRAPEGFTAS